MELLEDFVRGYETFIAFFSGMYVIIYILLTVLAFYAIRKHVLAKNFIREDVLMNSPLLPGVTVVAPAFNEAPNIIFNVKSLLSLNYPNFEVVIINDGSTDNTLEKLIDEFEMEKIDFYYVEHIKTEAVRGHYKW